MLDSAFLDSSALDNAGKSGSATMPVTVQVLTLEQMSLIRVACFIRIDVRQDGAAVGPVKIDVSQTSGAASMPLRIDVRQAGSAAAPIQIAVVSGFFVADWTLTASIGGVDVSAALTGQVIVQMEEGASRTAEFSLHIASTPVNPLSYVGKTVAIDLVQVVGGVSIPSALFRGRLEYPDYQPRAALMRVQCSQDLQHIVAAMSRTTINTLTGGGYHRSVHGDIADNYDYAQACMETRPASLDCGVMGNPRATNWNGLPVWRTLTNADLDEPDISIVFPRRADLINRVDCEFEYRYTHLRERHEWLGWSASRFYAPRIGAQYPTVQDIQSAVSGGGWEVVRGVYFGFPSRVAYDEGWVEISNTSVSLAQLHIAQRHSQPVTETSVLTVTAPDSITNSGTIAYEMRGALASEWSPNNWESSIYAPLDVPVGTPPSSYYDGGFINGYFDDGKTAAERLGSFAQTPPGYAGGPLDIDWSPDAPRSDAESGIATLLGKAKTKILSTHRLGRVSGVIDIASQLDVDRALRIEMDSVVAQGKVVALTHTIDIDSGQATTAFSIAVSGIGAAGFTVDTPIVAPVVNPVAALKKITGTDTYSMPILGTIIAGETVYSDGHMGWLVNPPETITVVDVPDASGSLVTKEVKNPYPTKPQHPVTGFRVALPGVNDTHRMPADTTVAAVYSVAIPEDAFTL